MKLQEIERSSTVAWSPLSQFPAFLAAGTVAGSLDVDFDTSAHLEIMQVDFANKAQLTVVGKASAPDRFNKVCWGLAGVQNGTYPKGLLAGGLNNGVIGVWNPHKIIGYERSFVTCIAI
jgi:protein transport protein SEC31